MHSMYLSLHPQIMLALIPLQRNFSLQQRPLRRDTTGPNAEGTDDGVLNPKRHIKTTDHASNLWEQYGKGGRKNAKTTDPENVLLDCVFCKWQGSFTHDISTT